MAMTSSRLHPLKNKRAAAAAAGLLALGALGFSRYRKSKSALPEESALAAVTRGKLELRFKEIGEIAPKNSVNVASKVSGRIISLSVHEGSVVSAGDALAVIQPGHTEAEHYLPSTVAAPISGIVMRHLKDLKDEAKFCEIGDYVVGLFESQTTPTYLMTLADMRQLVVRLKISEMDILKLSENMPVTVGVDALQGSTFSAHISMIAPQAEKDSGGGKIFRVEVKLDRSDHRLRTGMTARVDALLKKKPDALKMPVAALFDEMGQTVAYVSATPKPRQVKVAAGLRTELEVEILSGLREKDRVLTEKPADFLPWPNLKPAEGWSPPKPASSSAESGVVIMSGP